MPIDEDIFLRELLPKLTTDPQVVVPAGDDCAVLTWTPETHLLITVDQVCEGIHFADGQSSADRQRSTPPALAGRKLLARNISDVAAMGGVPKYALLALGVPRDRESTWLENFTDGILEFAKQYDIHIIGGDLAAAGAFIAGMTLVGHVRSECTCRRSTAMPADRVMATGRFGGSIVTGRHLEFEPRLAEGRWLAEHGFSRAMIDVSDGLLKDLNRLCLASRLTAVVDTERIPRALVNDRPVDLANALLDGEDYELLFSTSAATAKKLAGEWPFQTPLTEIGYLQEDSGPPIVTSEGHDLIARYGPGYDHFRKH